MGKLSINWKALILSTDIITIELTEFTSNTHDHI